MEYIKLKEMTAGLTQAEAIAKLDEYIAAHPESDDALLLRGIKHWGAGHRSQAMTDYLSAIDINPASQAREALKAAKEILDYRNKDLYNP